MFEHEGFVFPRFEVLSDGGRVFRPGFLGNVLVGAATAVILAALYSPLGSLDLSVVSGAPGIRLTLQSLAGAMLSGIGGSRLLTREAERGYDQVTKGELFKTVDEISREPQKADSERKSE